MKNVRSLFINFRAQVTRKKVSNSGGVSICCDGPHIDYVWRRYDARI